MAALALAAACSSAAFLALALADDPDATTGAADGAALLGLLALPPAAAATVSAGVGVCLIASSTACCTFELILLPYSRLHRLQRTQKKGYKG